MSQQILNYVEQGSMKSEPPQFEVGDTVDVHTLIIEGEKQRVQVFTGTVLSRVGGGTNEMFTVRRIVNGEGVERIFPVHSPAVSKVEVRRSGVVRRAKLHYLRDRVGKATRLADKAQAKRAAASKNDATKTAKAKAAAKGAKTRDDAAPKLAAAG